MAHPARSYLARPIAAAIFAAELFSVQAMTLHAGYPLGIKGLIAAGARLILDLLLAIAVVHLPRSIAVVLSACWVVFALVLLGYYDYFQQPLCLRSLSAGRSETGVALAFGAHLLDMRLALTLVAAFAIKTRLLWQQRFKVARPRTLLLSLGLWFATVLVLTTTVDPLSKLRSFASFGRMGVTYGYLPVFAAEAIYLDDQQLGTKTLADQEATRKVREATSIAWPSIPPGLFTAGLVQHS